MAKDKATPPPSIPQLALEIRTLAHRGWEHRPNTEVVFRAIGERAQKISELAAECTAPAPQHWAMIEDEPAGVCWEEDRYPDAPQSVSANIGSVTCVKCLQFYITMNDLKRAAATPQVTPTIDELVKDLRDHYNTDWDTTVPGEEFSAEIGRIVKRWLKGTSEQASPTPEK